MTTSLKLLTLYLSAIAVAGCATVTPARTDTSSTLLLPLTQARLDLRSNDLPAVAKDLDRATAAANAVATQANADQIARAKAEKYISDHHDDYLGAKSHRLVITVAIAVGVLGATLLVLYLLTGVGAPIAGIAAIAFHSLTLGSVKIATKIESAIKSRLAKK